MSEEKRTEIGRVITMYERLSPAAQELINSNIAVLLASEEARRMEELEQAAG